MKITAPEIYPADANGASDKISTHPLTSSFSIIMPRANKYNFKHEKTGNYVICTRKRSRRKSSGRGSLNNTDNGLFKGT
jgi:hypothetical protein